MCLPPPPWCSFDLGIYIIQFFFQIYHNFINNFWLRDLYYTIFSKYIIILLINFHLDIRGLGQTHSNLICILIGHVKKGCEFNQKRCEFKILQKKNIFDTKEHCSSAHRAEQSRAAEFGWLALRINSGQTEVQLVLTFFW